MGLGVHYNWAVPRYWFLKWFAGDQQEADAVGACLHDDFVAAIEENERAVAGFFRRLDVEPAYRFGGHGERAGCVAEFSRACENVGKGVASGFDRPGGTLTSM